MGNFVSKPTKEPENYEKAYEYAVFLLSLKLRTKGEVESKMKERGYSPVIVERVVAELMSHNYINDENYAAVFLDNLKKYKNFGYFGIKKKFFEKKLSPSIINETLERDLTVDDEMAIAKRFLKKEGFIASVQAQNDEVTYRTFEKGEETGKQKMAMKLKARGFRPEIIAKLVF